MIRTNGFGVFRGPDARGRAERAGAAVERYSKRVLVDELEQSSALLAYAIEGGAGLPAVHGFAGAAQEDGELDGEFALAGQDSAGPFARRDRLGTRPLYADATGSVASDHRMLRAGAELLPAGCLWRQGGAPTMAAQRRAEVGEDFALAARHLAELLESSVLKRVSGHRRVAVSFSGGLDSSLIAHLASKRCEVVLCSAYASGSRDERETARAASSLGLGLKTEVVDGEAVARELRRLDLPFEPTEMDKSLWCIYSTTGRMARESGSELLLLGQLADELFGGYRKYAEAALRDEALAQRMMDDDTSMCASRAFVRDEAACSKWVEARFPFADSAVAALAAGAPVSYKVRGNERKVLLREAAAELGLPEELAGKPKKAAQYSTGIAKLVGRTQAF